VKVLRLVLIALAAALLVYGVFWERHTVYSRPGVRPREISSFGLIEAATADAVTLKEGKLYEKHRAVQTDTHRDEGAAKDAPSKPACPT